MGAGPRCGIRTGWGRVLDSGVHGLRRGELLALRWRDVDFAGSTIRVRASFAGGQLTTPKSGKVRAVPMAPDVASALAQLGQRQDWVGEDDLVFAGLTGNYLDGSALCRRYKAALARAGSRQLRFHALRHTFGTRMIAKADIHRGSSQGRLVLVGGDDHLIRMMLGRRGM